MVLFKNPRSFEQVKKTLPRFHIEPTRNVPASITYCSKDEGRLAPTVERGERPAGQGSRSDLRAAAELVLAGKRPSEIAIEHPDVYVKYHKGLTALRTAVEGVRNWEVEVTVITGSTGTGKTRKAFETMPNAYWKEKGDWWDGYEGQEDVIIDEFAMDWKITDLLRWLDRYPLRVPIKGGFVQLLAKRFIITSNINVESWYPNALYEHKQALKRRLNNIIKL